MIKRKYSERHPAKTDVSYSNRFRQKDIDYGNCVPSREVQYSPYKDERVNQEDNEWYAKLDKTLVNGSKDTEIKANDVSELTKVKESKKRMSEAVIGNTAIVYHRTSGMALVNAFENGSFFIPGSGDYYGVGFYSALDAETANIITEIGDSTEEKQDPEHIGGHTTGYGQIVVKVQVDNLENYLCCDRETLREISKNDPKYNLDGNIPFEFIKIQLEEKGITLSDDFINSYFYKSSNNDISVEGIMSAQAGIAKALDVNYRVSEIFSGLIYKNGSNDGNVLVTYMKDVKNIIPIAYMDMSAPEKSWVKINFKNEDAARAYRRGEKAHFIIPVSISADFSNPDTAKDDLAKAIEQVDSFVENLYSKGNTKGKIKIEPNEYDEDIIDIFINFEVDESEESVIKAVCAFFDFETKQDLLDFCDMTEFCYILDDEGNQYPKEISDKEYDHLPILQGYGKSVEGIKKQMYGLISEGK